MDGRVRKMNNTEIVLKIGTLYLTRYKMYEVFVEMSKDE